MPIAPRLVNCAMGGNICIHKGIHIEKQYQEFSTVYEIDDGINPQMCGNSPAYFQKR